MVSHVPARIRQPPILPISELQDRAGPRSPSNLCIEEESMIRMMTAALIALTCVAAATVVSAQESATMSKTAVSAAAPINLNSATSAQLEALPGIGVRTAERIIEYRQKNGGFKKIEDLMNVQGIGEKSFLKLKPLITVAGAKTERASQ
jgi:comEA protein